MIVRTEKGPWANGEIVTAVFCETMESASAEKLIDEWAASNAMTRKPGKLVTHYTRDHGKVWVAYCVPKGQA